MKRYQGAQAIRDYLGPRLIRHDEWGSIVDYSGIRRTDTAFVDRQVGHYHGASAQIPRIRKNALIYGDKGAEIVQMRYVDRIHYIGNGWAHGFTYCVGGGPLTGLIYEARSLWYPHGAHHGDEDKSDSPIYFAYGRDDDDLTEAQLDIWYTWKQMNYDLFGMSRTSLTDHGSIPGNSTQCAGSDIRALIRQDKEAPTVRTQRVAGPNRYATNVAVNNLAQAGTEPGAVAVASGESFADGLSAANLAAIGVPVLITPQAALATATRAELISLNPSVVYIIGGIQAVSPTVEAEISHL